MKRSEMLLKLQRYYGIKHVMVEEGYITPSEFMDNVLQLVEDLGMSPPFSDKMFQKSWNKNRCPVTTSGKEWEEE